MSRGEKNIQSVMRPGHRFTIGSLCEHHFLFILFPLFRPRCSLSACPRLFHRSASSLRHVYAATEPAAATSSFSSRCHLFTRYIKAPESALLSEAPYENRHATRFVDSPRSNGAAVQLSPIRKRRAALLFVRFIYRTQSRRK